MLNRIMNLFGMGTTTNFSELMKSGAIIIDVRSKREFESGHIDGSINIPVDELTNNLNKLKDKSKTIIACCASGMRSASATSILKASGYTQVYNGGGWSSLKNKL
jgi:rhodanese-related sulfurtransferase